MLIFYLIKGLCVLILYMLLYESCGISKCSACFVVDRGSRGDNRQLFSLHLSWSRGYGAGDFALVFGRMEMNSGEMWTGVVHVIFLSSLCYPFALIGNCSLSRE